MSWMSFDVFKPATYVPDSDPLLMQRANQIADAAQADEILEATCLAVKAIAYAFFVNIPYHLAVGTFNAVNFQSEEPVLEHYQAALMNLAFSVLSVVYVVVGIFYPAAYECFRVAVNQASETKPTSDPDPKKDKDLDDLEKGIPSKDGSEESPLLEVVVHEPGKQLVERPIHVNPRVLKGLRVLEERAQVILSKRRAPQELPLQLYACRQNKKAGLLENYIQFLKEFQWAICKNGVRVLEPSFAIGDSRFIFRFDFMRPKDQLQCVKMCQQGLNVIERLMKGQGPLRMREHFPVSPLDQLTFHEWDKDFIRVEGPVLPDVGLYKHELYGQNGAQMRRMGYRVVLDEYIHVLRVEFGIDIDATLKEMESWPKNSSVDFLRNTLLMLHYPEINGANGKPLYQEAEGQYKAFVLEHRKLIASYEKGTGLPGNLEADIIYISQALATTRFMANIQGFSADFVKQHIHTDERVTPQNFHEVFVKRNHAVEHSDHRMRMSDWDTKWRQAFGAISRVDFLSEPDVPNLRGVSQWVGPKGGKREILHLRHATPHIPGSVIAPEYREVLRAKEKQGEGVLYTGYQRLNDPGYGENEHSRCQSLIELEKDHPNFYLLFHSVENALFKNPGKTFADLKRALLGSFYHDDAPNANRLPVRFQKDRDYQKVMAELFDQVHDIFFNKKEEVDLTPLDYFGTLEEGQKVCEWQICIMIFYYFQREDLKFRTKEPITTEVNPCKDNFDRGGGQNVVSDRMRQHQLYGRNVPSSVLKTTMDSIQSPPIMGKGLAVIPKRINPALAVSQRLATLSPHKMDQLQQLRFNGWALEGFDLPKIKGQHAVPLVQDARTAHEAKLFIQSISGVHTLTKNTMVEENSKCYPTKEALFKQLGTIFSRARIEVDGTYYNGSKGWFGGQYDAQGILDYLMTTVNLSEKQALRVMCQLEVQIFTDAMVGLKKGFDNPKSGLLVQQFPEAPHEVVIQLETHGKECVVKGKKKMQLQDMSRDGATLAVFETNVTLRIPKNPRERETGEWSWKQV